MRSPSYNPGPDLPLAATVSILTGDRPGKYPALFAIFGEFGSPRRYEDLAFVMPSSDAKVSRYCTLEITVTMTNGRDVWVLVDRQIDVHSRNQGSYFGIKEFKEGG